MALFETMRENTKVILWITVIAFVGLIFLAWGADFASKRSSPAEAGVLAKVNGERISNREFADQLTQARSVYQQQTGSQLGDAIDLMLQQTTWDNLINRTLIRQQVREHNITVSDREVATALVYSPPPRYQMSPNFQTDGQFDIQKWQSWIADPRVDTRPLEREQRDMVGHEKMRMRLLSGIQVTDNEVREAWLQENEKCDLAFGLVSYFKMLPDAQATDAELEAYLREHADDFRHPERAALKFVRIEKAVSTQDSLEARDEMREAEQDLRRGDDFNLLVKDYSHAPPSRCGGETATLLTRQQISQPEVAEAAFTLPVGEISEVIASSDGYHMLRVEERTTEDDVEKVKIAEIFIPIRMSYDTNIAIRDRMLDLADSTGADGYDAAAERAGLRVNETGLFDPESFIPGLSQVAAAKEFVRDAAPGEISKPIQTTDAWYLMTLVERRPPEPATLEDVRGRVQNAFLLEKRKAAARAAAEAILERARGGDVDLKQAVMAESLAVFNETEGVTRTGFIRGVGSDPLVTGAAFAAGGPGLIPYVVMGKQGAFVIEVGNRHELDEEAYSSEQENLRARLLREKQNRVLNDWMEKVRNEAKIEDYRLAVASR